jgi:autotransporter-associated beta strand protein
MKNSRIAFHVSIAIAASSAHAADRWWDGGTTNLAGTSNGTSNGGGGTWNASILNWDQGSGYISWDNANFDVAIFGGAGGTVTLGAGVTVNRMVIEAGTVYNFAGETANQNLTFAGTTPTIDAKTSVSFGTSAGASKVIFTGTNGLTVTGAGVAGAAATSVSLVTSNAQTLSGGLTFKNGVTFAPSVRSYTGPTNLLDPNNSLTFDGGHFTLTGFAGRNIDQTLGNASFNTIGAGTRFFVTTSGSSASTTTKLHVGTITGSNLTSPRAGGVLTGLGSVAIAGTTHAITTTTAPTVAASNTYGPRMIYTTDGGATTGDWTTATDLGGGVYQLAPYVNYNALADDGANDNLDAVALSSLALTQDQTRRTLKMTNGCTLDIGIQVLTLNGGGLISTGSSTGGAASSIIGAPGATCFTAGPGSNYELMVHPYNSAGTTISAVIGDHPNGTLGDPTDDIPVSVTINNLASNPITLSGSHTFTGLTTINGNSALPDGKSSVIGLFNQNKDADPSTPEIDHVASAFGAGTSLTLNGAVLQTTGAGSSDRDVIISGNSGFYVKGTYAETLTGVVSGTGTFSTDGDFGGSNGGTGNLILAGDNTFSGDAIFRSDSRFTLAHANALKNATLDLTGLRILADLKTNNLSYNIGGLRGNVSFELGTGGTAKTVTIGGNNQSNTYAGVISGDSGLTKSGTGTQTLLNANTYGSIATGSTVVAGGTLKLGSVPSSTINGTGPSSSSQKTIQNLTGTAGLAVGQPVSGGSVAAGAVIVSVDSPSQVTLSLPHTAAFTTAVPITFGAINSSIATPVIEVKAGATLDVGSQPADYALTAAQTLGGAGTVTGPINVSGKISPGVGSVADATILAPDLVNTTATLATGKTTFAATGEYSCSLNGAACDLLAAGNLTVAAGAKITFSGTPTAPSYVVATYTGAAPAPFATDATLPAGYSLDYGTPGQIKLVGGGATPPYDTWTSSKGLSGAGASATADPDSDGLANAIEFVVGGEPNPANPGSDSNALLPTVTSTATDLVFTFRRTDVSMTQPGAAIVAEYSSTLGAWTTAQNGVNGVTIAVTDDGFGAGVDKVDVSIPKALATGSKLFVRLSASF